MSICRTCLSAQELIDLFAGYDAKQLLLTTGLTITPDDELPQKICRPCSKLVDSALLLREQGAYAQQILLLDHTDRRTTKKVKQEIYSDCDDVFNHDDDLTEELLNLLSPLKIEGKLDSVLPKSKKKGERRSNRLRKDKKIKEIEISSIKVCDDSNDVWCQRLQESKSVEVAEKNRNNKIINISYQPILHKSIKSRKLKEQNELSSTMDLSDEILEIINCEHDINREITEAEMSKVYEIMDAELKSSKVRSKSTEDAPRESLAEANLEKKVKKHSTRHPRNPINRKRCEQLWSLALRPTDRVGPVTCARCHKQYQAKYFLRHATTHFDAEFTCEMCGLKFININTMRSHQQRRHGGLKRHACSQCDYRAVLKEELLNHENRVHTGLRPFVCDACAAGFCQRRTLVQHMRRHHPPGMTHPCDFCPKRFGSRGQMTSHRNMFHLLRYTYFCYICPYRSGKRQTVRNHLTRTHGVVRQEQSSINYSKEKR